jgi:hypothetical protein
MMSGFLSPHVTRMRQSRVSPSTVVPNCDLPKSIAIRHDAATTARKRNTFDLRKNLFIMDNLAEAPEA